MFIDARSLEDGVELDTDICVIGGGAAGITIARELTGKPLRIVVLEGGGFESDAATQSLYRGANSGFPYFELDQCRLRYFGGTTNHWAGYCRPLEHLDFERREWVAYSGWPFGRAELDRFYAKAHEICELAPYSYDVGAWERRTELRLPAVRGRVATALNLMSPPTRFGQVYRRDLERAENVTTYLNASVIELEPGAGPAALERVRAGSLDGKRFSVRSRAFILAAGGIENARLLLASDGVHGAGIGNQHDLVGRFFMDHVRVEAAVLLPSDPQAIRRVYLDRGDPTRQVRAYWAITPEVQRSDGLLNTRAFPDGAVVTAEPALYGSAGVAAVDSILTAARSGQVPADFARHLRNVMLDLDDVTVYVYRELFRRPRTAEAFYLVQHIEQAPNPDSRVTLAPERDALGMSRVRLDWRFGELERRTCRRVNRLLAMELGRAGIGRVRMLAEGEELMPSRVRGAYHHMGTTRMSADPRRGVVDANCRVHGVPNLYVAGSSVFPTCGYTNPTLTIVALALRLAEHLERELRP